MPSTFFRIKRTIIQMLNIVINLLGQPLIGSLQNSGILDGRLAALAQEQRSNDDDHLPLRGCPSSEAAIPRV